LQDFSGEMMMKKSFSHLHLDSQTLRLTVGTLLILSGCGGMKSFLAVERKAEVQGPILNPFGAYENQSGKAPSNIVLRTRKGERSVEVELPSQNGAITDLTVPVSPAFPDESGRSPASASGLDTTYLGRSAGPSDREIAASLPKGFADDDGARREVETGLGLREAEGETPDHDQSYLASLDHVKQLYRVARYEAALLEVDELLVVYPTDSKIHEMRGTLLDRLGRTDLAIRSWNQAIRLNPGNESLRRFVERRANAKRSPASQ
jgi:hypothetical protein